MTTAAPSLAFARRGTRRDTLAGPRVVYRAPGQPYRLEKSILAGLPIVWRAMHAIEPDRWVILSRHRTRTAAERAANLHARRST